MIPGPLPLDPYRSSDPGPHQGFSDGLLDPTPLCGSLLFLVAFETVWHSTWIFHLPISDIKSRPVQENGKLIFPYKHNPKLGNFLYEGVIGHSSQLP